MILAGDVGGTNTRIGFFRRSGGKPEAVREEVYPTAAHRSLESIIGKFLGGKRARIERAAFAVAGPVIGNRSQPVHVRFSVDGRRLAARLGLQQVEVLNDLEASTLWIPRLSARRLVNLTPGVQRGEGNAVMIASGTGLGTAILFWDGERHVAVAGEGGHQGFAPRNDLEIALLRALRRRHGRVSLDRVVAGPGLTEIYRFLMENDWSPPAEEVLERIESAADRNAAIGEAAVRGDDPLAVRTVEMFVSLYGSAAGDLALAARATGGVYVGGGIAPKILPFLRDGGFVKAFRDKGRLSPLVEKIPVRVILEPRCALLGAAVRAAEGPARMLKKTKKIRKK